MDLVLDVVVGLHIRIAGEERILESGGDLIRVKIRKELQQVLQGGEKVRL